MKNQRSARRRRPAKSAVEQLDQITDSCARIATIAGLIEAAGTGDLLDAALIGQAGRLLLGDIQQIQEQLSALNPQTFPVRASTSRKPPD